jgi:hypothetical protein
MVSDEKLTVGLIFLKCHQCNGISAIQGKAAQQLIRAAEMPLRTPAAVAAPAVSAPKQTVVEEEPLITIATSPVLPPVPEFLKADRAEQKKVHDEISQDVVEPLVFESSEANSQAAPILIEDETLTELHAARSRWKAYALPTALALVCFASGGYLLKAAQGMRESGGFLGQAPSVTPIASDLVPGADSAARAPEPAPAVVSAPAALVAAVKAPPTVAHVIKPAREPNRSPAIVSRSDQPNDAHSEVQKVQPRSANVVLRAGPGTQYNKVGTARAELQMIVRGSFDHWIEVQTGVTANKTAWIRSDLVKPINPVAQQEAQP